MQQRVHERSGVPAGAGMNHHAGGLIDSDYIGVLIEDFDRKVFRLSVEWRRRGGIDLDRLGSAQQIRRLRQPVIDPHTSGLDPFLQTRAAIFGQALVQIEIEPVA